MTLGIDIKRTVLTVVCLLFLPTLQTRAGVYHESNDFLALEKRCSQGLSDGCMDLARIYYASDNENRDYRQAFKYFSAACALADAQGCGALGVMYYKAVGVKADFSRALHYFKLSCSYGYATGCGFLGYCYERGLKVKQDPKLSKSYYLKACKLGLALSCESLSENRADDKAFRLFR